MTDGARSATAESQGIIDAMMTLLHSYPPYERRKHQWRIGREAYFQMIEEAFPPIPADHPNDHPVIKESNAKSRAWREEQRTAAIEAWGKEGSTLYALPVVCDEDHQGVWLEPRP